jgi:hypothetical protein
LVEERIIFLTTLELPEYCFVSEAIEWFALGRVPQAQWVEERHTDNQIDYRFYWREMPDNFQPSYCYPWFEREEFEALGIKIDEKYFAAAEKCFGESVGDLPDRISEYEAREQALVERDDGSSFDIWKSQAEDYRKLLVELGPLQVFVDGIEAQFHRHYEIAFAKLFPLLARCEIECTGLNLRRWEKFADHGEYEKAAKFEALPASCFSLAFDWKQNKINAGKKEFAALRIRTNDILKHRSFLLQQGKAATLEQFGSFYMTKGFDKPLIRQKRGRPHGVNWSDLRNYLSQMVEEKTVPSTKESCLYELIAYAERRFGKSPSRSSVQRNLSDDLLTVYAQNKNHK